MSKAFSWVPCFPRPQPRPSASEKSFWNPMSIPCPSFHVLLAKPAKISLTESESPVWQYHCLGSLLQLPIPVWPIPSLFGSSQDHLLHSWPSLDFELNTSINSEPPASVGSSSMPAGRVPKHPFVFWVIVFSVLLSRHLQLKHFQREKHLVLYQPVGQAVTCWAEQRRKGEVGKEYLTPS